MRQRAGVTYGVAAYALWGMFPLYFTLFARSSPYEVVAHRALWSLVLCGAALSLLRQWREVRVVLADRRTLCLLAAAGFLIVGNWSTYVAGVTSARALDAALGYFINPLAVAALGIVFLRERLRRLQWVALALGCASVSVMVVGYGQIPWIALILAGTFGTYSLVKKLAGRTVGALAGLALETGAVAPCALVLLAWMQLSGQATWGMGIGYDALLASTGVVTAVPLLLFAAAARRVSMLTLAVLQYLAPIGQFLLGWLVLREPMPPARWVGFSLIWAAIIVFVIDAVIAARRVGRPRG